MKPTHEWVTRQRAGSSGIAFSQLDPSPVRATPFFRLYQPNSPLRTQGGMQLPLSPLQSNGFNNGYDRDSHTLRPSYPHSLYRVTSKIPSESLARTCLTCPQLLLRARYEGATDKRNHRAIYGHQIDHLVIQMTHLSNQFFKRALNVLVLQFLGQTRLRQGAPVPLIASKDDGSFRHPGCRCGAVGISDTIGLQI